MTSLRRPQHDKCDNGVPRARLHAELTRPERLVLIRAPHGYGKSTLVTDWLNCACSQVSSTVWVPRPVPGTSVPDYRAEVAARLDCRECEGGHHLPASTVGAPGSRVVVLDRVDLLGVDEVDAAVAQCLRLCRHVKVVATLCTGLFVDSPIAVGFEHTMLTADDLRYTREDTDRLHAVHGTRLRPAELDRVHRRAGGVPALEVVVHAATRDFVDGPDRGVRLDRTVTEILSRYVQARILTDPRIPGTADGMLLQLATARELTVEAVRHLTGASRPADILAALDLAGVLGRHVAEDGYRWRFTPAIREVLLTIARNTGIDTAAVLSGLGRFHVGRGEPVLALPLFVDAGDWVAVMTVVERDWIAVVTERPALLREALNRLPAEAIADRPGVRLGRILCTLPSTGAATDSRQVPPEVYTATAAAGDRTQQLAVGCLRSLILRSCGDIDGAVAHTRELGRLVEAMGAEVTQSTDSNSILSLMPVVRLHWAITYLLGGLSDDAAVELRLAYVDATSRGLGFVARTAAAFTALNWALVGETGRARAWLDIEQGRSGVIDNWLGGRARVAALTARALVGVDVLDLDAAGQALADLADIDEGEELWAFVAYARSRYALFTGRARIGLIELHRIVAANRTLFRAGAAVELLTAAEIDLRLACGEGNRALALANRVDPDGPWVSISVVRGQLLAGDLDGALSTSRRVDWMVRHHPRAQLGCSLAEAAASLGLGDHRSASRAWEEARHVSAMTGMLADVGAMPGHTVAALDALGGRDDGRGTDPTPRSRSVFPEQVRLVRLSERERVVLEQLARGQTVRDAAATLFVSVNTVKTQQRSLYRKLGVHTQGDAVSVARRLGLVHDHLHPGGASV